MSDTVIVRHYPKNLNLVRRSSGDIFSIAADKHASKDRTLRKKRIQRDLKNPKLISSAHGNISHLLLTIPAYAVQPIDGQKNPIAATYIDLLSKLSAVTNFTVVTHSSVESIVTKWFKELEKQVEIISVEDNLHFSIWAEDGYVISKDETSDETFFVEPYEFLRYADGLIADIVSNNTSLTHTQVPLYFQGGNVLIGDDFFFIGADYPKNSLKYINKVIIPDPKEDPADMIYNMYGKYLDSFRKLYYIGSTIPVPAETKRSFTINGEEWTETLFAGNKLGTVQPLFHIDMFITFAGRDNDGKYQLLVGDPSLAAKALKVELWPHAMQEVFDNIGDELKKLGFSVIRNPLPLVYVDDPDTKERLWYFATANNALVEIPETGEKKIWLPSYGFGNWTALNITDKLNVEIWESLGFKATLLDDFHPFAENLGAVHCIKKYLSRE